MKYLVTYKGDMENGKEFNTLDEAIHYMFDKVINEKLNINDMAVFQSSESYKPKHMKEEPVCGIQMTIFDLPEYAMNQTGEEDTFCEEEEDEDEEKEIKSLGIKLNTEKVNKALNGLLNLIKDNNIDYAVNEEDAVLALDLSSLITNNIELKVETE